MMPVVRALARQCRALISVDTSRPEVIEPGRRGRRAMINDVRALAVPGALAAVARTGAAVCLMHMQGEPRTMQQSAQYADVVAEVRAMLAARLAACAAAGIGPERLCVDPGFGFGKLAEHNLQLLRQLGALRGLGDRCWSACRASRCSAS